MIRPYFALRATKGRQRIGKLLENKELKNYKKFWDFPVLGEGYMRK